MAWGSEKARRSASIPLSMTNRSQTSKRWGARPLFMSIEEYLGRNTQKYYDVLAEVGRGSWQPGNDARPWIRFILTAHLRQARTMLRRVRETE